MRYRILTSLVAISLMLLLLSCTGKGTEASIETEFKERMVQTSDGTLYARVAGNLGSGNVLIALHGGPGNSSDYMVSLGQLAGEKQAVVIFDQRGTGRSTDLGSDAVNYSFAKYVEDIEAVREAAGADKISLLGHSWGGVLAMRYAASYPQHVLSMVLMGSGAPSLQAALAAQEGKLNRIAQLQEQGLIPKQITGVNDILPAYFSDPRFDRPPELDPLYYKPSVEQSTWSSLGDFDFTAETNRLVLPVLVLYGKDDPFGMLMVNSVISSLSNAETELVLLENCGHYWQECPDQFFPRVKEFLDRQVP